jgi:hypothetical protein
MERKIEKQSREKNRKQRREKNRSKKKPKQGIGQRAYTFFF